eukprot:scaffold38730_cov35-Cyclotella_meneghiniana.AAC.2
MATCLFVDENNMKVERGNKMTYNHLVEKGIIKEGLPGREFIDDNEDVMNGDVCVEFSMEPSIFTIYYFHEAIPKTEYALCNSTQYFHC